MTGEAGSHCYTPLKLNKWKITLCGIIICHLPTSRGTDIVFPIQGTIQYTGEISVTPRQDKPLKPTSAVFTANVI